MRAGSVDSVPPDAPSMTLDEWADLDAPGELVDGRLVEDEVPDAIHETVVMWFALRLGTWARDHGARLFGSGLKYGVDGERGRMPDLTLFLSGRRPPGRGVVRSEPDLAIEVVSPTPKDARRDRVEKLRDYASFGIRWYWIVDPGLRTFEVMELREGVYAHVGAGATGEVSDIPGLPDLVLDLDALWAEVDDLDSLPPGGLRPSSE